MEEIKEEYCCCTKNAFLIVGLENISENNPVSKFVIEKLVHHVGNIRGSSNTIKYPIFSAFMKCGVLSISHRNSATQIGFSINKYISHIHGHSLKEDTIEVLRVVRDAIVGHPSLLVTKEMFRSVKASRQRYEVDLEAKRLLSEKNAARKRRRAKGKR